MCGWLLAAASTVASSDLPYGDGIQSMPDTNSKNVKPRSSRPISPNAQQTPAFHERVVLLGFSLAAGLGLGYLLLRLMMPYVGTSLATSYPPPVVVVDWTSLGVSLTAILAATSIVDAPVPYWVRLAVIVDGDELIFDYSRSDEQAIGPINAPYVVTLSASLLLNPGAAASIGLPPRPRKVANPPTQVVLPGPIGTRPWLA